MTLGSQWTPDQARRAAHHNTRPPRPAFGHHAAAYAAKLAADTILDEHHPHPPDLSDQALVDHFALCAHPLRTSETAMVRVAFTTRYTN